MPATVYKWIIGASEDEKIQALAKVVASTKQTLDALGIDLDESPLALDQYRQAAEHLKETFQELNTLKTRPLPIDRLNEEINKAIEKDKDMIENAHIPLARRVSSGLKRIDLYQLKHPHQILRTIVDEPAKIIRDEFLAYRDLRRLLREEGLARLPDLWIRQQEKNKGLLTRNGLHWVYAKPTEKIDMAKDRLDIDVVDVDGIQGAYIVATLQEENGQEVPVVLDLAKGGEDCCQSRCGTLMRHLGTLWRDRIFTQARRLTSEHKPDPRSPVDLAMHDDLGYHALDDDWFDRETNELYLRYRMRPQATPSMAPVTAVATTPITTVVATPVTTPAVP